MGITKEEALQIDHEKAKKYAKDYMVKIQNQIIARGNILNGAIQEFNSFLNLPASSSAASAIWDFAFGLLSTAIPALRLGDFIKKQHDNASQALAAAKIFHQTAKRSDKAIKVVTGGLQGAGKLATHGNSVKDLVDKASKISPAAASLTAHASRGPILELIKELNDATDMCLKAEDTLMQEWINRLDDKDPKGSLEDKIRELLKDPPQFYSPEDLNEIWTLYLWYMVAAHVKQNVYYAETIHDRGWNRGKTTDVEVKGLNDTQEGQIKGWFGPVSRPAKFFQEPPVLRIGDYYNRVLPRTKANTRTTTIEPIWSGRMQ